jgi:hypothetical protein
MSKFFKKLQQLRQNKIFQATALTNTVSLVVNTNVTKDKQFWN